MGFDQLDHALLGIAPAQTEGDAALAEAPVARAEGVSAEQVSQALAVLVAATEAAELEKAAKAADAVKAANAASTGKAPKA